MKLTYAKFQSLAAALLKNQVFREDTAFSTGKWELGLLGQKTEKALRSF
jgi:hypothetical protein